MPQAFSDLSSLVGSRICHDLISPIGAIGNGVELLELSTGPAGAEMALIAQSVEHAQARIRFFRVAFGSATPGQMIARSEVQAILSDMAKGSRLQVDWQVTGDLERVQVRLAFLLLLCCETALPVGGTVRVQNDGQHWHITANADRVSIDEQLWSLLKNPAPAPSQTVTAAQVQFPLAAQNLAALEKSLEAKLSETEISLTV